MSNDTTKSNPNGLTEYYVANRYVCCASSIDDAIKYVESEIKQNAISQLEGKRSKRRIAARSMFVEFKTELIIAKSDFVS